MNTVILTNEQGESLDTADKLAAHKNGGRLHKAFSVFVCTPDRKKVLIQKRSNKKLLFAGIWANTCCSHPKEEKPIEQEAQDRMMEECGFSCPLTVVTSFTYKADDPNGNGTEWEYDTVLIGEADESTKLNPDPDEIAELKWVEVDTLRDDMKDNPNLYAPWLHKAVPLIFHP